MSTVQEIIDFANRKYPNSGESTANMILDLNDIQKEVFVKILKLRNEQQIWSFTTADSLPVYDLPADCSIDLIISVQVSKSANPSEASEYDTYEYAGLQDDVSNGNYFYDGGKNLDTGYAKIGLVSNGENLQTDDLEVRVFYYKRANVLTLVTDTPNLNPDYHSLLKYALITSLASGGQNPDTQIADYYQAKFDEFFKTIQGDISNKFTQKPTQTRRDKIMEYMEDY
jgi:hypothetical protein